MSQTDLNRFLSHFPIDYADARKRFMAIVSQIKAEVPLAQTASFQVPSLRDKTLFVDDLYVPPLKEKKTLLILTSGVHGIEGATGSAIQNMFFADLWAKFPRESVGLYAVHCLNPFGFKFGRRATENNVNLNRAFAPDEALFQTKNDAYRELANLFAPKRPVHATPVTWVKTLQCLVQAMAFKGFNGARLNQSIAQGQYEFPDGLEYGGKAYEPQIRFFIDRLKTFIGQYKDIVLYDLHTGLGENAQLHIIPGDSKGGMHPELLAKFFNPENEKNLYAITPTDAAGFYQTTGDLNSLIPALATAEQRVLALTLEFGTLGIGPRNKIETLDRLRLENEGYHKGYASPAAEKEIARRFRELFFPTNTDWRAKVLTRAHGVLQNTIDRF